MTDTEKIKNAVRYLDEYMTKQGKEEINEMEANRELARGGLLDDEISSPGRPLRNILRKLRDANLLPDNIRQICGSWKITKSSTISRQEIICLF